MTNLRTEEVLAESKRAIDTLTRLAAKLEAFTDQIEASLARHDDRDHDDRPQPE